MPTLIRQALFERISKLPALREHLESIRLATGVTVRFVGPLGQGDAAESENALCRFMRSSESGRRRCTACLQRALERAMEGAAHEVCDAGGRETAVPLRVGGQVFGYFVFGGYLSARAEGLAPEPASVRAAEICPDAEKWAQLLAEAPVCEPAREAALVRLLELVATQLALIITDNLAHPEKRLPEVIEKACALAREHYAEPLSLSAVAERLSVSVAHLSRLFHHSTGLPFNEYLTRLRTEQARKLLLTTGRNVTEIAYDSGFQSISQFNRAFKAVHGVSPRSLRERGSVSAKAAGSEGAKRGRRPRARQALKS